MTADFPIDPDPRAKAADGGGTREAVRLLHALGRELAGNDPARAKECYRRALDLATAAALSPEQGQLLRALGLIELQSGDLESAERLLSWAKGRLEASGDRLELAACQNTLAAICLRQGRTEEAMAGLRTALAASSSFPESDEARAVRAETLENLGAIYRDQGDPSAALRSIQDALALRRAINDSAGVALDLDHLGKLFLRQGQLAEARQVLEEAIEMRRRQSDRRGLAMSLNNLASTLILLGELKEAHALFDESRALCEELGLNQALAGVHSNLGLLAAALGRMDEADARLGESLRLYREGKDVPAEAVALGNLAYLSVVRGHAEEALRLAEESLALRHRSGLEGGMAKPLFNAGRALLELGRPVEAEQAALSAIDAATRSNSEEQRAEALSLLATVRLENALLSPSRAAELRAEAKTLASEAMAHAKEAGDPRLLAMTFHGLGRALLALRELDAAQEAFSTASRHLRGYEHAYERALLLHDEGRLLHEAGALDAAAERFRRAHQEFQGLGNLRWRARSVFGLAAALAESDPRESARLAAQAKEIAAEAGVVLPSIAMSDRAGASSSRFLDALLRWIASAWNATEEPAVATELPRFMEMLSSALDLEELELRCAEDAARAWRRAEQPLLIPGVEVMDEATGLRFLRRVGEPTDSRHAACFTVASLQPPCFELEARRSRPFDAEESRLLTLAARALEPSFRAWLERGADAERGGAHIVESLETGAVSALIGESGRMRAIRRLIRQVAPSNSTVLLLGESGTGKELAARALHDGSDRRGAPFIAVNCPSIPRDLMESELFGHERGAFTGAVSARAGKVEAADKGTLFLDEVADMDLAIQAKLLRFLEQREFERVGGQTLRRVDVRVVAATSQDLVQRTADGRFREDLFYRLNVVQVNLPPLRERREDIPQLVDHLLAALQAGRTPQRRVAREALDLLVAHEWPGNVRELKNALEHLVAIGGPEVIGLRELPAVLRRQLGRVKPSAAAPAEMSGATLRAGETLAARLREVEASLIRAALEQCGWNQSAAARRLGVTEGTVRARMGRYGIAPKAEPASATRAKAPAKAEAKTAPRAKSTRTDRAARARAKSKSAARGPRGASPSH